MKHLLRCGTFFLLAACSQDAFTSTIPYAGVPARAGSSGLTVTTTITDGSGYQIRSDGGGAYRNSSTLISIIQSVGASELDSYNPKGSTRAIYLDFSQPLPNSGPGGGSAVAIPSGLYKVHAIAKCNLYNTSMLTLTLGQTIACPLHIGEVWYNNNKYAVQMNPRLGSADTAFTETNWINATCTSASGSGSCTHWQLLPSGTGGTNVAALLEYVNTTVKGKTTTTIVKQGDFSFAFQIDLNNP